MQTPTIFRAGRLDEPLQLARLHVAGVVFDRHLDAGIDDLRARVLEHRDQSTSMCFSMPPRRSAPLPSTARTMGERTIFAASTIRASCSSAVPCSLVEHRRRRANRSHADLEIEPELVGVGPHLAQVVAASRLPRNRISLKCTTLTFHFAAKSICSNGVQFCAPRLYMSTPKRTGPAGVCAVVGLSAVPGAWRRAPVWPRPGFSRTSVDLPACHPLWARNPSLSSRGRN